MAAMTTAPWSSSHSVPSSVVIRVGWEGRPSAPVAAEKMCGLSTSEFSELAGGSLAGKDSSLASSAGPVPDDVVGQRLAEHRLGPVQRHPVLRALRAGQRRDDGGQVQFETLGVVGLGVRLEPQALPLRVRLDQRHLLVRTAGELQVLDRLGVDREDRAGRSVLRRHVADGRPVGQRDGAHAGAVELDELADHAVLAQHLGDRQHQVGGGGAGRHLAGQLEPDHPRDEHADRLAQHGRLGLDAADAPAEHAQAVDHRGVRVGADERVRVGLPAALHDRPGQIFDVDLVHDAGAGRDDLELVERGLAPAQELVALPVALVLQLDVAGERVLAAEQVGDHRVVDHQLGRGERVHLGRVATQVPYGLAHGGQVDHARHAGEVLHQHPGRGELDLHAGVGGRVPAAERADVVGGDVRAVLGPQQVLQQDLQGVRQARVALHLVDRENLVARVPDAQLALRTKGVQAGHVKLPSVLRSLPHRRRTGAG